MDSKRISLGRSIFLALFSNISVTWVLIFLNFAIWIICSIFSAVYPDSINYFALNAGNILAGKYLWTILTHMFSHLSFFHLFVNMFSLYFVGGFVERIIGRKRFVWFYLISGVLAGLLSALLAGFFGFGLLERIFGSPTIPMLGASGAIFGLVGLLAVLVPRARVYLIAGPLIAIIIQAALGLFVKQGALMSIISLAVNAYIILSIFMMFSFNLKARRIVVPIEMPFWMLPIAAIVPLVVIGMFVFLPIGNVAHFGGLVAGLAYGWYLRRKYAKKVQMLQKVFR